MLLAHSHWHILHHLQQNFIHDAVSHHKNKSKKYIITIMFLFTAYGSAILNAYTHSRFKICNKIGVNEDYRLLDCEATQLANVLENVLPPSSG
jgi:hypothetical protein